MNNTFWLINISPTFGYLLVLFIVSLIFKHGFEKRLASQVGMTDCLPHVKEMLQQDKDKCGSKPETKLLQK